MIYKLTGLHCRECAKDIETKINQSQNEEVAAIDYDRKLLKVSEKADLKRLSKILNFEKIIFTTGDVYSDDEQSLDHTPTHSHSHESSDLSTRNTKIVFFLNAIFAVIEFIFGGIFNSAAIIADAFHDTGDAFSIGIAWFFQKLSTREPNEEYTFGHKRFSLLGAITTSIVLIVGSIAIMLHSVPQVFNPTAVNYQGMLWLSIFAIIVKLFCMWLMNQGRSQNERMLNLHMLEDVLGWFAVLIVSVVLHFTDWYILDPLLSVGIALFILYEAIPMFNETVKILLEATPPEVDIEKIEKELKDIQDVENISHLHIWSADGDENMMTVTVSTTSEEDLVHQQLKEKIRDIIFPYHVTHSTIEIIVDKDRDLAEIY